MTARRLRATPIVWIGLGLIALLLVAACKSEAELEAERAERDGGSATATATVVASPTSDTPTPAPTSVTVADEPAVLYVANTGGSGVSLRSDCRTEARIAGAWPEGKRVEVVEAGSGACEGWTMAASGSTETWIDDRYLSSSAPTLAARSGGSTASTPGSTTVPPASSTTSAVPGEFRITNYWFTFDQYGFPSLHFTALNVSNETILELAVDICLFDPEGRPVQKHGSGPTCFRSTHLDLSLAPGETFTPYQITTFAWSDARVVTFDPYYSRTPTTFWRP